MSLFRASPESMSSGGHASRVYAAPNNDGTFLEASGLNHMALIVRFLAGSYCATACLEHEWRHSCELTGTLTERKILV
jgi:hypothetical protein